MKTKNIELMIIKTLEHYSADQVKQGNYWSSIKQKGCFIGCLTHSDSARGVTERFGIDEDLVLLLENIYEGLTPDESKQFFKDIPYAIGEDGRNLSKVKWAFLRDTLKALPEQEEKIKSVIDPVIEGMEFLAAGIAWPHVYAAAASNAASYAVSSAYNSASASASAASSAAYSASYYSASYYSSVSAAYSAADAAADAAAFSAAGLERTRQAESILALIKAA